MQKSKSESLSIKLYNIIDARYAYCSYKIRLHCALEYKYITVREILDIYAGYFYSLNSK